MPAANAASLRAIRKAVERLSLPDAWVRALFYDNGMNLLAAIRPGSIAE